MLFWGQTSLTCSGDGRYFNREVMALSVKVVWSQFKINFLTSWCGNLSDPRKIAVWQKKYQPLETIFRYHLLQHILTTILHHTPSPLSISLPPPPQPGYGCCAVLVWNWVKGFTRAYKRSHNIGHHCWNTSFGPPVLLPNVRIWRTRQHTPTNNFKGYPPAQGICNNSTTVQTEGTVFTSHTGDGIVISTWSSEPREDLAVCRCYIKSSTFVLS